MIRFIFSLLRNKTYETQVVLLTALLATVRVTIALFIDINRPSPNPIELITDTTLFITFGSLLIMGLRKANFQSVHPIFGILIILLMLLNFIEFAGANGASRFNYYSGIFVIILLYSGRWLSYLLVFQLTVLTAATVSCYLKLPWVKVLFLNLGADPSDFIFGLISIGLLAFYLKSITINEIQKFEGFNEQLRLKVSEAKTMNHTLMDQGNALQQAQQHLEKEVRRRSASLQEQQRAIEAYIHLNTAVLKEPIEQLKHTLGAMETNDTLSVMLQASGQELNVVFQGIKETLDAQEELTRTKIRPS